MSAAISALIDFMSTYKYCTVDFEVWDGRIQVGIEQLSNDWERGEKTELWIRELT